MNPATRAGLACLLLLSAAAAGQTVILVPPVWSAGEEWMPLVDRGVERFGWKFGGGLDPRLGPVHGEAEVGESTPADVYVLDFSRKTGLSLREQGAELIRAVESLRPYRDDKGSRAVYVVGYSMGGLAARAAVAFFRNDMVRGIVTVATPNAGTPFGYLATPDEASGARAEKACRLLYGRPPRAEKRPGEKAPDCGAVRDRIDRLLAEAGLPGLGSAEVARLNPLGAELRELNREPVPAAVTLANVVLGLTEGATAPGPWPELADALEKLGPMPGGRRAPIETARSASDGFVPVESQFLRRVGLPPYVNADLLRRQIWSGSARGIHGEPFRTTMAGRAPASLDSVFEALRAVGWAPPDRPHPLEMPPPTEIEAIAPEPPTEAPSHRAEPRGDEDSATVEGGRVTRVVGQYLSIRWKGGPRPTAGDELEIWRRGTRVARVVVLGASGKLLDAEVQEELRGATVSSGDSARRVGGGWPGT